LAIHLGERSDREKRVGEGGNFPRDGDFQGEKNPRFGHSLEEKPRTASGEEEGLAVGKEKERVAFEKGETAVAPKEKERGQPSPLYEEPRICIFEGGSPRFLRLKGRRTWGKNGSLKQSDRGFGGLQLHAKQKTLSTTRREEEAR